MTGKPASSYSLGGRLIWLFAIQTLLGLGGLSLAIYAVTAWSLSDRADAELARKSELVKHLVSEASGGGEATMRHKLDEFFMSHEDMQVTLFGARGEVTYQSPGRVPAQAVQRMVSLDIPGDGVLPRFVRASIKLDRDQDAKLLGRLAALLLAATLLGAVALSLSGAWTVRGSLAPMRGLGQQMRSLRAGQLGQRLLLSPMIEELQPWIEQFNDVLARLDASYRQLESFNADVAHELRTPLATLIGQTELALSRRRAEDDLRETLGSNLEEVRRLSAIVNDMLFLSRADSGAQASAMARGSVRTQVEEVAEFHEGELAERELSLRIEGDISAPFEPGLLRRAASNLLGNAVRYADPGSEIVCSLREQDSFAWLEVTNVGREVPAEALPRLFDRFYRVQSCREGSSGNHGLGLAIVAAIARMHGGATVARSAAGRTTVGFSMSLRPEASGGRGVREDGIAAPAGMFNA